MRLAVCECARGEFWGNNLINLNIPLEKKGNIKCQNFVTYHELI